MTETGGMLDTYLIAQALGWEWNFTTMMILWLAPIIIIGGLIFLIFFVFPFVLDKTEDWKFWEYLDKIYQKLK